MNLLDITFCIGILFLISSSVEDLIFRKLFSTKNKISRFLFFIHPILLILIFISKFYLSLFQTSLLGLILLIVFYVKSKNHIVSYTLEHHYESITTLLIVLLAVGNLNGAFLIASIILISSLSAGYAKTQSILWTSNPTGMKMFLCMPWLTRKTIANFFNKKSTIINFKELFLKLITRSTPYFQIISTLLIIIYLLIPSKYDNSLTIILFVIPLIFQFLFPILLFVIGGLGFIPFYYIFCIFTFLLINQLDYSSYLTISVNGPQINNYVLNISTFLSLMYLIFYLFSSLGFINFKLAKIIGPFVRKGPFHMYTERNMLGMIVFFYSSTEKTTSKLPLFPQPFNFDGKRSQAQNFTSQKFYCLYYSVMDFILWNQSDIECDLKSFKYNSEFNYKVISNIFSYLKRGEISLIQFNWNKSTKSFKSNKFANVYFNTGNNKFKIIYSSEMLPCSH